MRHNIDAGFTVGAAVAEYDPLLLDAYIETGTYEAIKSRSDRHCFIIGRTGSGKSAALRLLENECPDKVIRIAPENLAMTYITNLDIMPRLIGLGVRLDPFLKALWKHVFIVEILRRRYDIRTEDQKQSLFESWRKRFRGDSGKQEAINYLNAFGDRFWCETDQRVQQIAQTFEQKFAASGGLSAGAMSIGIPSGAHADIDYKRASRQEVRTELADKYQRIVGEIQIPRLNKMMEILNTEILDSQHFTYIVIDDLDRDWVDGEFVNLLVRCLFEAAMDMSKVTNLKILVALRTNIFEQLHYGDVRRGEQTEKLEDLTLELRWDRRQLHNLLAKRVEVASRTPNLASPLTLEQILPATNRRIDAPLNYILARTLLRPRDAILFVNECLKEALGRESMTMDNIYEAEKRYSQTRLNALRDEWKDPYLGIDRAFEQFRRFPSRFPRPKLTEALDTIAILDSDSSFRGSEWLRPMRDNLLSAGSDSRSWLENYGSLTELLYRIGFLGIVRGRDAVYSYEEPAFLASLANGIESSSFEVHPAFHQALHIYPASQAGIG